MTEREKKLAAALSALIDLVDDLEGDCAGSEETGRWWSPEARDLIIDCKEVLENVPE